MNNEIASNAVMSAQTESEAAASYLRPYHESYHELAERHGAEADVLEQLKSNLAQLEDLHGRMRFMMAEISYLLKKN
jgi:hypothetical protein